MTPGTPRASTMPISIVNGRRPSGRRCIPTQLSEMPSAASSSRVCLLPLSNPPAWMYVRDKARLERWTTLCAMHPLSAVRGIREEDASVSGKTSMHECCGCRGSRCCVHNGESAG